MRKFVIDTDTGSDDAVAILMALLEDSVDVLAMTTVSGNVPMEQAALNCLQTMEVAGCNVPVYKGADRPLMRQPVHAQNVHGEDGMGDKGLIHPRHTAVPDVHAADAIIDLVHTYPDEVELIVIGPATNIALAIMKAPEIMKKTKAIWTMGTCGFGPGNATPVSEFNVYADAEAYKVMLESGIPIYIGGYDVCFENDAPWNQEDIDALLASGSPVARFAVECNSFLLEYYKTHYQRAVVGLPDAVAIAGALWNDVCDLVPCISHVCIEDPVTYGQVILYDGTPIACVNGFQDGIYGCTEPNCYVMTNFNSALYKQRLYNLLTK